MNMDKSDYGPDPTDRMRYWNLNILVVNYGNFTLTIGSAYIISSRDSYN